MMAKKTARKRRSITRTGIKRPEDTDETIADLRKRLEAAGKPKLPTPPDAVVGLKRSDIRVAEKVFQWRLPVRNMLPRDDHILDLARALRDGAKFPPILVFPVGREYYVMDGHHRLAAYDTEGWTRMIPAKVFSGTLAEATRMALRGNARNKLPMTKADRLSAAWRLVKEEAADDSIATIASDSGVSKATVSNMRAVLATLKEMAVSRDDIVSLSWESARRRADGIIEEREYEDWFEAEANKLVEDIIRHKLGGRLTKNPDVTALALAKLNEDLPAALSEHFRQMLGGDDQRQFDPHAPGPDEDF
jgi:ParB-like chromosome segregation protein Spo0J